MTFNDFSQRLSEITGKAITFQIALAGIAVWAATGPWFHYNDTWQLIVNTSTTIITFLMVFLIQNTQNRDNDSLHIKLDELLRVTTGAQDKLLYLENLDARELKALREQYAEIGKKAYDPKNKPQPQSADSNDQTTELETDTLSLGPCENLELNEKPQKKPKPDHSSNE